MSNNLSSNHVNGHAKSQAFVQEVAEKERLIKLLASERFKTMQALRNVNDFTLIYQDKQWRIKDILGHIATWEREALATLQALNAGDTYSLGENLDIEQYNQQQFEQRKSYFPAQIRMDWGMVRHDLQFAVNQVSPEMMFDVIDLPWNETGTISQMIDVLVKHEAEHLVEIMAIIQSEGSDQTES